MDIEQKNLRSANDNIINQLIAKYFPYWPLFLFLILVAIGGAWLYLQFKLPVFESTATILIKDEKKGIEDSKMMESLNLLTSKKIIENEIEIIKSRALMGQVVKELQLYAPVFETKTWKDISAYQMSPVKIEAKNIEALVEVKKLNFAIDAHKGLIKIEGNDYPLNKWVLTPWGNLQFTLKKRHSPFERQLYFSIIHPKRIVQNLITNLEVSSSGKLSSVINLKFKDEVAERSEDILSTLVSVYDKASINDKNILAINTLSFLDERMNYVSKDLDSIEKQLQRYKSSKGAIDISSQGKLFLQNVSENDQKLSDVNMKLAVLKQIEGYVFAKDNRGGLVPSTLGVDDPLLTNLLNKLYDTELQYEKLKGTTGENNPELTSLANRIDKIKPSVLENIHNQQFSLEASKRNLFSTNNSYTTLLQTLPQQERDLVEISREQNIKSSIYSFLLQKREETALSHSSTASDTRIVDKAEFSLEPVSLGNKFIYAIAIFIAIGVGVVLITARELFNRTILFRKEIEEAISSPVIGEINLEKSKKQFGIEEGNANVISEGFRMLQASLYYLGICSNSSKILVTSSISGEGKTFVALKLAMSLALSGKKVILLDFDLNNPTIESKLGLKGGKGVADYLMGKSEADEVIQMIENNNNLFVITAGNLPHNTSKLVLDNRTLDLLNYLKSKFDYVLVDSSPVCELPDGYVLSRYCDATLYVVRHGHTPKKILERLEHINKINQLKNFAIVFNGIRPRGFMKNSYGFGYGYMHFKN